MRPMALTWIGTRTPAFDNSVAFFRDVLELPVGVLRPNFVRLDLPDDVALEVFRPGGDDDHPYFTTGPVIGFQVGDFDNAVGELRTSANGLLGAIGGEVGDYRWQHFRAPDAAVYEIVDFPHRRRGGTCVGPCRITGFGWVGIRTDRYEAMCRFVGATLGLSLVEEEEDLAVFEFPNEDVVELFRAGGTMDHPHLTTGPVPGLWVEDLEVAEDHLRSHGVEILARKRQGSTGWVHFRAPDGCVYEFKRRAERHPQC
jgi:catechol 2,3-dioxygenase-like lactoylglutathione lyase family enzyme